MQILQKLVRAFSCDLIAAMLEGKNNTFSLPWEIRSIFMQNCFIVSALQHGCRENPLFDNRSAVFPEFQCLCVLNLLHDNPVYINIVPK